MSLIGYYWNPVDDRDIVNTNRVLDKSQTVMVGDLIGNLVMCSGSHILELEKRHEVKSQAE